MKQAHRNLDMDIDSWPEVSVKRRGALDWYKAHHQFKSTGPHYSSIQTKEKRQNLHKTTAVQTDHRVIDKKQ